MFGFMCLQTISKVKRRGRLKSNLCCFSRNPLSSMSVFTLLICALIYIISRENAKVYISAAGTTTRESNLSILLTTGSELMWFQPSTHSRTVIISDLFKAAHIGLDYSLNTSVFWADAAQKKIYRKLLGSVDDIHSEVVSHGIGEIQGLAVDWIDGHLYWVDGQYSRIEVSKLDGSMRSTLLEQVNHSLGLVIDPLQGLLFWTSLKNGLEILERSNLDGSSRKQIYPLTGNSEDMVVGALALDISQKTVYWINTKHRTIHCSDYDGTNHVIIGEQNKLSTAISLAVFEEYVYWVESENSLLLKAPSRNITETVTLTMTHPALYDIQIYEEYFKRPSKGAVSCLVSGCSHLCLRGENAAASCFCPYSLQLSLDNRTCQKHGSVLGFANTRDHYHNVFFVDLQNPQSWIFPPLQIPVQNVVGFAADPLKDALFWIDTNTVQSQLLTGEIRTVIHLDYFSPNSLALDWRSRNLYLLSGREFDQSVISICKENGKFFTQLVWQGMHIPKQLVVDPENRFLFWLHYKQMKAGQFLYLLESSSLDGSERKEFLKTNIILQSFVADPSAKQLCWLSQGENSIVCQHYYEGGQRTVKNSRSHITVMCSYNGNLLYADQKGSINGVNISMEHRNSVSMNTSHSICFLTVMDPKYSAANYYKLTENFGNSLCIEKKAKEYKCQYERAYPYLFYTSFEEPHALLLYDSMAPDMFPGSLFSALSGDTVDVFVDSSETYFWVEDGHVLKSLDRMTGTLNTLISSEGEIKALAVDTTAQNVYWTVPLRGEIWVSRFHRNMGYIVLSEDSICATSLAVDSQNGLLIWANLQTNGTFSIQSSSLSGKNRQLLVHHIASVGDLCIENGSVYWANPDLGRIEKFSIEEKLHEVILGQHTFDSFKPHSLFVHRDIIYWTDRQYLNGSILTKNLKKSNFGLVKRVVNPGKIFVVEETTPNGENPCHLNNGGCDDMCLYGGSNDDICFCSYGYTVNSTSCKHYSSYLAVANGNRISSIKAENVKDPNAAIPDIHPEGNITNFAALAYDPFQERIYFSLLYRKPHLFSIFPNGTGLQPELKEINQLRLIEGMAYDVVSKTLLWTDVSRPSIWALKDGVEEMAFLLTKGEKPRGIAVHGCSGRVFWTNYKKVDPKIEIGWLGTSHYKTLISEGLNRPEAIAVFNDLLFWSDISREGKYSISSVTLDANHRKVLINGEHRIPFSLVPFEGYAVWTDRENGVVCLSDFVHNISCTVIRRYFHNALGITFVKKPDVNMCQNVENVKRVNPEFEYSTTMLAEFKGCEGEKCSKADSDHMPLEWQVLCGIGSFLTLCLGLCVVWFFRRRGFGKQLNLIKLTQQLTKQGPPTSRSAALDSSRQVILQTNKNSHAFEMGGVCNSIQINDEEEGLIAS